MKIFLDDKREPPNFGWLIARTIDAAREPLEKGLVTDLSLDNDLGRWQEEGYKLVEWMIHTGHWPTNTCVVHSNNRVAATRLRGAIEKFFKPKDI
jgi:hypothetical protein